MLILNVPKTLLDPVPWFGTCEALSPFLLWHGCYKKG